jgi:tRNA (Thr-GGU) A37 N-methylase
MSEHSHHALLLQSQAPSSSSSSSSLPDTNRSDNSSSSSYHIIDSESELKICNASRAPGGIGDDNQIGQNKTDDNANNTTTAATTLSRLSSSPSPQQPPMITMQPIGYISSIYRLCVGTPRQGLLAPNSRGRINLFPNRIAFDSIQDLEYFSHVWIVFVFHLNSNGNVHLQSQASESMSMKMMNQQQPQQQHQFPSKIKPPALGGKRVGIFATRSPHRPNPIGFGGWYSCTGY